MCYLCENLKRVWKLALLFQAEEIVTEGALWWEPCSGWWRIVTETAVATCGDMGELGVLGALLMSWARKGLEL